MIQFPIYCIISGETSFFISDLLESIKTTKYFKFKLSACQPLWKGIVFFYKVNQLFEALKITQNFWIFISVQFSSVAQSCPSLYDPMNCSTPGLPIHHQFPEFTQTHVHRVGDAIQPSHPLSSPFPLALNPSQHQSLFQSQLFAWGGQSTGVWALPSFLPKNTQDWSPLEWTGWISLQSKGLSRSSPTSQFNSINSSVLSLLHSPTVTSIHDHWKNHSLD